MTTLPLPLAPPSAEASAKIPSLRFGRQQVPLTQRELEWLQERLQAHVAETGTTFGFVAGILDV